MFSPRNAHERKQLELCILFFSSLEKKVYSKLFRLEVSHNSNFKITSLLQMANKSLPTDWS